MMTEYRPPIQQTIQLERHPFTSVAVYKNGTLQTGASLPTIDYQTGSVILATAPAANDLLLIRYAPVWFTDDEIERMMVVDTASENLVERVSGEFTFATLKTPLVYAISIDGVEQSTPTYDEIKNTFALETGSNPYYGGTVCNVYATAAYLFSIMASDPDRIRANYQGKISDIPSVQESFRKQSEQLFKLGGMTFD